MSQGAYLLAIAVRAVLASSRCPKGQRSGQNAERGRLLPGGRPWLVLGRSSQKPTTRLLDREAALLPVGAEEVREHRSRPPRLAAGAVATKCRHRSGVP
jgi:hypothetical protein